MRKFALFSCGTDKGKPFLNYEVLWTPILKGRLKSHAWLNDTDWESFVDNAEVGEVFNGHGTIIVVRLKETAEDWSGV